jgi:Kef-type K+ transport system membrane component KefB
VIGATALADTSISIVYTTLNQFGLSELPIGRLVLAATLSVNLLEDASVTTTTFLTAPALVFTLAILGALLVAALALPRIARAVGTSGAGSFANESTRALLFSLAVLSVLSSFVGVPGILFVFLMGLIFAEFADSGFVTDLRKFAFALFVPIYFISVGLKVSVEEIRDHWELLVVLVLVASALKLLASYLSTRAVVGARRAPSLSVLMNARLTSATVILLLTLTLGIISSEWYSVLIAAVVILALGSSVALSAFSEFKNRESAVSFFGGEASAGPSSPPNLP